uniref:Uncharacterized protein n=1 Tax=Romanomermis culicivorax TaxID=13658 RepID=A0A915JCP6_ROMCU
MRTQSFQTNSRISTTVHQVSGGRRICKN